jgi:uncharacterized protein (TIRG00374 family)
MAMQITNKMIAGSGTVGPDIHSVKTHFFAECPSPEKIAFKENRSVNTMKLAMGSIFFLIFSIGVFQYQFEQIQVDHPFPLWKRFEWSYLVVLFFFLPLDTLAGSIRIWAISRIIQPGMTYYTCFKSELANIGTGMLTPSQTGGGLGQIYILCRGGSPVSSATTISFISFTGTLLVLLGIGLYSLFFSDIGSMEGLFRCAVMIFVFITVSMLLVASFPNLFRSIILKASMVFRSLINGFSLLQNLCAIDNGDKCESGDHDKPGLSERLIEILHTYRKSLCHYLRVGKKNFIWVLILSFAFLFSKSLVAFLCLRSLGIHRPSLGCIVEIQLVLLFLIYFAPTPGGAGVSEFMSLTIMSTLVPAEVAPYYHLLWRTTTLYLPAVAGLIFVSHAVVLHGRETFVKTDPRSSDDKGGLKK